MEKTKENSNKIRKRLSLGLAGILGFCSLVTSGCSTALMDLASKQDDLRKAQSLYGLSEMARRAEDQYLQEEIARQGRSEINIYNGRREDYNLSPWNSTTLPDGRIMFKDGRIKYPNGRIIYPKSISPNGFINYPDGTSISRMNGGIVIFRPIE